MCSHFWVSMLPSCWPSSQIFTTSPRMTRPKHSIPTPTALLISVPWPIVFFFRPVHSLSFSRKDAIAESNKCDPPSFSTSRSCHRSPYRYIISILGEGLVTNFSPATVHHWVQMPCQACWIAAVGDPPWWNRMSSTRLCRNGNETGRRIELQCNVLHKGHESGQHWSTMVNHGQPWSTACRNQSPEAMSIHSHLVFRIHHSVTSSCYNEKSESEAPKSWHWAS